MRGRVARVIGEAALVDISMSFAFSQLGGLSSSDGMATGQPLSIPNGVVGWLPLAGAAASLGGGV